MHLQDAIQTAQRIDQQSKAVGFNQQALDQMARQGFTNAQFEVNSEEGLDLVEEFYTDEDSDLNAEAEEEHAQTEQAQTALKGRVKTKPKFNQGEGFVQEMQQGLQGSVRAMN